MKFVKLIFSGEFMFALYLSSGTFKAAVPIHFIDLTILFLLITMLIALKRIIFYQVRMFRVSIIPIFCFGLIVILSAFSLNYSPSHIYAIDKLDRLAVITSWCFLGVFLLFRNKESIEKFLYGFIALAIVMAIDVIHRGSESGLVFQKSIASTYLTLAQVTSIGMLLLLSLFIFKDTSRRVKIALLLIMGLVAIPIIQSGARSPLIILSLVVFFLFLLMFRFRENGIFISRKVLPLIFLVCALLMSVLFLIQQGHADTLIYRIETIFKENGGGASVSERTKRLSTAIEMIEESPFLGKGLGSFSIYYNGTDTADYPHNTYIEILAELGLIPFFSFLVINFSAIRSVYKDVKKNGLSDTNTPLILIFIFWFINSNISGSIIEDKYFFALLALLIILPGITSKEESVKKISINNYEH